MPMSPTLCPHRCCPLLSSSIRRRLQAPLFWACQKGPIWPSVGRKGKGEQPVVQASDRIFAKTLEKLRRKRGGRWVPWSPSNVISDLIGVHATHADTYYELTVLEWHPTAHTMHVC